MALDHKDQELLQEIVVKEGDCLDGAERCKQCPFRAMCLPEFLNIQPPTKAQRMEIALRILVHNSLIDSDMSIEEVKTHFQRIGSSN